MLLAGADDIAHHKLSALDRRRVFVDRNRNEDVASARRRSSASGPAASAKTSYAGRPSSSITILSRAAVTRCAVPIRPHAIVFARVSSKSPDKQHPGDCVRADRVAAENEGLADRAVFARAAAGNRDAGQFLAESLERRLGFEVVSVGKENQQVRFAELRAHRRGDVSGDARSAAAQRRHEESRRANFVFIAAEHQHCERVSRFDFGFARDDAHARASRDFARAALRKPPCAGSSDTRRRRLESRSTAPPLRG